MYNLRMLVICPQCQAENEDIARFCNQCGSALDNSLPENRPVAAAKAPPEAAGPGSSASTNWTGLIIVVIVILAIWYMVGNKPGPAENGMAGDSAPMMEQILAQVGELKDKLDKDPGDVDTVREMYELYGQVGKTDLVTEYTQKSLEHLSSNSESMDHTLLGDKLLALFIAAYENHDDAICLDILKEYHTHFPENIRILKVLGDMSYDNADFTEAIDYYDQFVNSSNIIDDSENYLNAMTDMGSCYIQLAGDAEPDVEKLNKGLEILDNVLSIDPNFWQSHYNRGVVLSKLERSDEAVAEWEWCRDNTDNQMESWRAEYAIAEMLGEELPPMPVNPHAEGFGGMANPHGEAAMANPHGEATMDNPHAEGSAPPLDGNNLPPNPHSEDFLKQNAAGGSAGDTDG